MVSKLKTCLLKRENMIGLISALTRYLPMVPIDE